MYSRATNEPWTSLAKNFTLPGNYSAILYGQAEINRINPSPQNKIGLAATEVEKITAKMDKPSQVNNF